MKINFCHKATNQAFYQPLTFVLVLNYMIYWIQCPSMLVLLLTCDHVIQPWMLVGKIMRQCLCFLYVDQKQAILVVILIQVPWPSQQTWWVTPNCMSSWNVIRYTVVLDLCLTAIPEPSQVVPGHLLGYLRNLLFSDFLQLTIKIVKFHVVQDFHQCQNALSIWLV